MTREIDVQLPKPPSFPHRPSLQAMSTQAQTNGVPEKQSNALERVHSIPFISEVRLPQLDCPTVNAALDRLPPRRAAAQDVSHGCHLRPCRGLVRRLRQAWPGASAFGICQRLRQQVPRVCFLSISSVWLTVCEATSRPSTRRSSKPTSPTSAFPLFLLSSLTHKPARQERPQAR
jgi:hypothetical protein